jgi:ABC-type multidrug transport system ATPase subunit
MFSLYPTSQNFYSRIRALNDVSFNVPEGSVFGILGPNGSGKTTLLSIILDVLKANNGNFLWFGYPGSPSREERSDHCSKRQTSIITYPLSTI